MVKTSSSLENEACCSKYCKKNTNCLSSKITELTNKLGDRENMLFHYNLALSQVEARLAEHRNQEVKYCEKIRVFEFKVESRADCIESLTKELELIKKEKEGLDSKLAGFQTTSKDLDNLLKSQRSNKNKEGLGYSAVPPSCSSLLSSQEGYVLDRIAGLSDQQKNKTDKGETVKKPAVKYVELYRKPSKGWENMLFHYNLALSQVEARLAEHRNQEVKYYEKIRVFEFKVESRADCIESLTKELELIKKEKEGLDSKLAGFQTTSKDLNNLLKSQRSNKNKEGLGYSAVPPSCSSLLSSQERYVLDRIAGVCR
nr:hypothetical protein [Tanacetum cinerariifolium]